MLRTAVVAPLPRFIEDFDSIHGSKSGTLHAQLALQTISIAQRLTTNIAVVLQLTSYAASLEASRQFCLSRSCFIKQTNIRQARNDRISIRSQETRVDSRDGLPVSAEPGLTHDILVFRTSVRPKACNQVTGKCKGGGLEYPPTNKLHMSALRERKFSQKLMGLEACNLPMGFQNFYAKHSNRKESPDSGGKPGTVAPGRTGLQESCRLLKRKRTRMAICTCNACTLASEAAIEDLMMQAKKIKHGVIGLTETGCV
ncbi:hypothetical protein RB195_009891 [Necator americanus]|uniref:Uncharacterized protein n=1 Tax=Necator americanus TaxID=51031 RepID=A0ABR1CWL2_NECAM